MSSYKDTPWYQDLPDSVQDYFDRLVQEHHILPVLNPGPFTVAGAGEADQLQVGPIEKRGMEWGPPEDGYVEVPAFLRRDATPDPMDTPAVLEKMAATYRERNRTYGDNYKRVGAIVALLFPNGISADLLHSDHWHLFELIVVKLTRFAISDLTHMDSIHDISVYGAMIESVLREHIDG